MGVGGPGIRGIEGGRKAGEGEVGLDGAADEVWDPDVELVCPDFLLRGFFISLKLNLSGLDSWSKASPMFMIV